MMKWHCSIRWYHNHQVVLTWSCHKLAAAVPRNRIDPRRIWILVSLAFQLVQSSGVYIIANYFKVKRSNGKLSTVRFPMTQTRRSLHRISALQLRVDVADFIIKALLSSINIHQHSTLHYRPSLCIFHAFCIAKGISLWYSTSKVSFIGNVWDNWCFLY